MSGFMHILKLQKVKNAGDMYVLKTVHKIQKRNLFDALVLNVLQLCIVLCELWEGRRKKNVSVFCT